MRVLVVGLARTGEALARRLTSEGHDVTVVEDRPGGDGYGARREAVLGVGATVVESPGRGGWRPLVGRADLLVPSPGVPAHHIGIRTALESGVAVRSELELAAQRIGIPIVAVTGTNGKTTVTELTARMLEASGLDVVAAGNIGRPLMELAGESADGGTLSLDVIVAEVSSFQLAFTERFRPRVAVLLAVSEDHTDWHGSFDAYVAAKARIFANQGDGDLLVYDADDEVCRRMAGEAPAMRTACSIVPGSDAPYRLDGDGLYGDGDLLVDVNELRRKLPHDMLDALAAAAAARHAGATLEGVSAALRAFETLPHRVALVGESGGVRWYDDSKATNPHAALAAARSFDSVVLLAGGRNKGLDLGALAQASDHIASVVAFGEAAGEVEAAFAGIRHVTRVRSMHEAVLAAAEQATAGDVVLLSPGCASFDAYRDYGERGDDFASEVLLLVDAAHGEAR